MFDQICGSSDPAKLTHEMNHHRRLFCQMEINARAIYKSGMGKSK